MARKIFYLIILFSISMNSQNIQTNTGLSNAISAYGYLLGQEYILKNIKKDYPDLKVNTVQAEMLFKSSLGKALENIELLISNKFSNEQLVELKSKIIQEISNLAINTIDTREKAELFIDEVKQRAKGNIQSPIREIILFYNFYKNPEQEY